MSRKQRVLRGLRTLESGLRQAATTGSRETLAAVSQNLTAARDVCRQGLPENSYAKYGEVYDGLILATRQMAGSATLSLEEDALALCQELLRYLIQETEGEKSFKKDIFFLPYKASMWDSLESVWKAAYEDKEHCNAYVMPIPYADLNTDRSVAEWHCERGAFPKYVPTLDWQQVDLKEWHPDVIFYHNPYDDYNHVTSVESRYYSRNLKECADKLVYIPYFVLEEPHPGNEAEEEGISHFILNPGIVNADQVIVQSEAMREVYINVLTKNTNQKDRRYWEKRISGAGSPKIDKVLTSKKEDFEMPEAWRKLAEGRKVILYNTSLNAMLQNTDKVCDKLRYVFDVFRDRKDVVLWWRPHPLMKSTFHSMRPQFEEEYLSLEKQYIEEGWGIYDDSSDLHRAICWSDAYYGDSSSVVVLYEKTRKPILMQYISEFFTYPISSFTTTILNNKIYCVSRYVDCLMELDPDLGTTEWYPLFYGGSRCITESFGGINILSDGKLLLAPLAANEFVEYDLNRHICKSIFDVNILSGSVDYKFLHGIEYKTKIFYYGFSRMSVVIYDREDDSFRYLKQCDELKFPTSGIDGWYHYVGASIKGHLLIGVRKTSYIVDIDMENEKIDLLNLSEMTSVKKPRISSVSSNTSQVAFVLEGNEIIFWRYGTQELNCVILPLNLACNAFGNVELLLGETYALCYAMRQVDSVFRDIEYISMKVNDWSFGEIQRLKGIKKISNFSWLGGDRFFLWTSTDVGECLLEYDLNVDSENRRYILTLDGIPNETFYEIFLQRNRGRVSIGENLGILRRWIEYVGEDLEEPVMDEEYFGKKIYDTIKQ